MQVKDMGRSFLTDYIDPFLGMGITIACFQIKGNLPNANMQANMIDIGEAKQ